MSRNEQAAEARCALCGAKESPSRAGEENYCRDCWDKKIAVEESSRASSRSSATSAPTARKNTSIYHSTLKRPCGQLIVVDDGYDLFLTMMLYPNFVWDEPAYHLEGDPEGRSFAELLVDVVATEVIEPWGGGSGTSNVPVGYRRARRMERRDVSGAARSGRGANLSWAARNQSRPRQRRDREFRQEFDERLGRRIMAPGGGGLR